MSLSSSDVGGTGHGTGDHTQNAGRGRGRALAMNDQMPTEVRLSPCEVVVVFNIEQDVRAEMLGDVFVDEMVVGRGVIAHEGHGRPVLRTLVGIQIQPGQVVKFLGQLLVRE